MLALFSCQCLLGFLSNSSLHAADPKNQLDVIRDAWTQRQKRAQSLAFSWEEEMRVAKGAYDLPPGTSPGVAELIGGSASDGSPSPPEALTLPGTCELLLANGAGRYSADGQHWARQKREVVHQVFEEVCNGTEQRELFSKGAIENPFGSVKREESINELLAHEGGFPIVVCYRILHPDFKVFDVQKMQLRNAAETEGSGKIVIVSVAQGRGRFDVWLDPARDYIVTRQTFLDAQEKMLGDLTIDKYRPDPMVGWVPMEWASRNFREDGSDMTTLHVKVTKAAFNAEATHPELALEFPPGARVNDLSHGSTYVVLPGGGKRVLRDEEKAMTNEQIFTRPWYSKTIVLLGAFAVGVIVIGGALYARRLARPTAG
ncbi:MAG: hypothetical protein ACREHD_14000 [Pirellulales bacterium]